MTVSTRKLNHFEYGFIEGLKRILTFRNLLMLFTVRNIRANYQGSYLGLIWMTINPLLLLLLYSFVFGFIFNGRFRSGTEETGLEYSLGLFLSLTVFQLFADSMNSATVAISQNPNLVKKVVFPLEILPVAVVGAQLAQFLISLALVILGLLIFGNGFYWSWLAFPLIIIPVAIMGLGVAYLFSLLGAYMRDISHITRFLTTLLLFGSAVFFSTDLLPEIAQKLLLINPLVHAVEQSRHIMLWGKWPDIWSLVYLNIFAILLFLAGFITFQKARAFIADYL